MGYFAVYSTNNN